MFTRLFQLPTIFQFRQCQSRVWRRLHRRQILVAVFASCWLHWKIRLDKRFSWLWSQLLLHCCHFVNFVSLNIIFRCWMFETRTKVSTAGSKMKQVIPLNDMPHHPLLLGAFFYWDHCRSNWSLSLGPFSLPIFIASVWKVCSRKVPQSSAANERCCCIFTI